MVKELKNYLKLEDKVDDIFYVVIFNSNAKEIIPVEVNLENIFYDFLEIATDTKLEYDSKISINMKLFDTIYSITGKIVNVEIFGKFYSSKIKIDTMPMELFDEIVSIIKNSITDEILENQKNRGIINF